MPSLNSPERSEGDGWCWANLQNTHFSGLTRKNPAFERSVLKYVSIKNRILTPSGQKRRVCVNAADRLLPPEQRTNSFAFLQLSPTQPQVAKANRPSATHSLSTAAIKSRSWSSLPYTRQSAARAMAGVGRICKIRVLRPEKEAPGF